MSSKRQPSDKENHEDSLQNSTPLSELYSITAGLRAHLLRLEKQGVWAVHRGTSGSSSDLDGDIPTTQKPRSTNERQRTNKRASKSKVGDRNHDAHFSSQSEKAVEHVNTRVPGVQQRREKDPEASTEDVTSVLTRINVKGQEGLKQIRDFLGECARCPLHESRNTIVFGEGNPNADLVFIGEAPGFEEDRSGVPFVGAAGSLFTKMLKAMGLEREEVYIANILKCRPPRNRDPLPEEMLHCKPFLLAQLQCIDPSIIIALGRIAAQTLLDTTTPISVLRGEFRQFLEWQLMPTFHPAYLLRDKSKKRPTWEDLQAVMAEMDRLGLKRRR